MNLDELLVRLKGGRRSGVRCTPESRELWCGECSASCEHDCLVGVVDDEDGS